MSCIPSLLTTYCDISKFGKLYIISLKKINKNQEICAACYRVTPCFFLFLLSLPPLILLSVIDMLSLACQQFCFRKIVRYQTWYVFVSIFFRNKIRNLVRIVKHFICSFFRLEIEKDSGSSTDEVINDDQ